MRKIVIDLFAGGGGASRGIQAALRRSPDIAINHWPLAMAVHGANHRDTKHLTKGVWEVSPEEAADGRPVRLAWFSPDCTHHSNARGGQPDRPKASKSRALAWVIINWARRVRPDVIMLENVREFLTWGPLDEEGNRIKAWAGHTFKTWQGCLRAAGYEVEWRILNAADFGAPTARRRLFIVARRDGKPIQWPEPTHGPGLLPYRTAAECIDWSIPVRSIFGRKKPLADKTMKRIARGIERFVLNNPKPFVVRVDMPRAHGELVHSLDEPLRTIHTGGAHALVAPSLAVMNGNPDNGDNPPMDVRAPLGTVTAQGNRFGLLTPTLAKLRGDSPGASLEAPMPTVTAGGAPARPSTGNVLGIVAPTIVQVNHGRDENRASGPTEPLPTVTAGRRGSALVAPSIVPIQNFGWGDAPDAADAPLSTITARPKGGAHALCAAFIAKHFGGKETPGSQLPLPLDTVTAKDHNSLAAAYLAKFRGDPKDHPQGHRLDEPTPTISAGGMHIAEVRAFLVKYFGTGRPKSLFDPMDTVTAKDRLGLVTVEGVDYQIVDIGLRMLKPHELLRAQFGVYAHDYDLSAAKTQEDQVRLIGNSVPPQVVEALVRANFPPARRKRRAA